MVRQRFTFAGFRHRPHQREWAGERLRDIHRPHAEYGVFVFHWRPEEHHCRFTSTALGLAFSLFGRCTFSTPSLNSAFTFAPSAPSRRVKLRRKFPYDRSMRWYFLSFSSFSSLRSPVMVRTPSSTVTFTSSFFTSGNSALTSHSFSSSMISTEGVHCETVINS